MKSKNVIIKIILAISKNLIKIFIVSSIISFICVFYILTNDKYELEFIKES